MATQRKPLMLLDRFRRAIAPRISFRLPPVLYHYTSAHGFHAIVSEGKLRGTNFSFLNDPAEVQHGRDLVERALVHRLSAKEQPNFFEYLVSSFSAEMTAEVYVACFTSLEDDLSQWRAYGSAAAERYAIGFDSEAIQAKAWSKVGASLHRVEYEAPDQQAMIDDIFDRSLAFLQKHRVPPSQVEPLADAAARRLARIMPALKNRAYKPEEEWRVVLWSASYSDQPQFDTARGVVRPYMLFELGKPLPIVEVRVMAPARKENALKAATMVLEAAGLTLRPQHSVIPFAD